MTSVFLDISVSVDGYAAGPNVGPEHPLGEGGERLHEWMFNGGPAEQAISEKMFAGAGAFVIGRRMFDLGLEFWGDDGTFGEPCFVVTHREQDPIVKGPTTFTFVIDGVESAVRQAIAAAGERDVAVMGGPDIAQQCLRAGLLDKITLRVPHLILGGGARLFGDGAQVELERTGVTETPLVTHLSFRVRR